ncbi:MAG TPA: long-chain-fatty-acid--CoA ligase [Candidatus Binataceae bacterium]|nr:long-chain-fatty-acid--CoA ligase [Candidatus Binataceae bacterium]
MNLTAAPLENDAAVWVAGMDVGAMMRRGARFHRQLTFLIDGENRLTFGDTLDRVDRLSRALAHDLGVRQGDRVAMLLHNRPEFIEIYWAVIELGAVIVPVNFRLQAREIAYILNDSGASILLAEPEFAEMFGTLRAEVPALREIVELGARFGLPSSYETLIAASEGPPPRPLIDERDPCSLLYTAGTTGFPKGAIRTHKAVMWYSLLGLQRVGPGSSYLAVPPMFHIGGQEVWIMLSAMRGGKIVLLRNFNPHEVLDAIERERISTAFIPPAIGIGMLHALREKPRDLSSLHNWLSASAPLPEHVRHEALEKLPGLRFSNGLGMTEAGGIAGLSGDDAMRKPSTCVGRPSPTVGIRIVGEDDHDLPLGEIGEIVIRSPQIVEGYWNKPEATAEANRNGWFHTGDAGCFDADGHLHVLDRIKDMVITGGENVYAAEVENVLFGMPEVLEAAIIGLPDPKWGEAVTAVVVLRPGQSVDEPTIISRSRQQLAHYKVPRRVIFVSALPRNAMGKVLKRDLRATYGGGASAVPDADQAPHR